MWQTSPSLLPKFQHEEEDISVHGSTMEKLLQSVMYGIINSILTIPCMYGYAAIIFGHKDFIAFMPALSKLVLLSSVVHQIMFTMLSSLPFAIGQVQVCIDKSFCLL